MTMPLAAVWLASHVSRENLILYLCLEQSVQCFAHQFSCTNRKVSDDTASYEKNEQVQQANVFKRQHYCFVFSVYCRNSYNIRPIYQHANQTTWENRLLHSLHGGQVLCLSTVSGGTLVTSLWDCIMTASSFGCQSSTDSAATSADHI